MAAQEAAQSVRAVYQEAARRNREEQAAMAAAAAAASQANAAKSRVTQGYQDSQNRSQPPASSSGVQQRGSRNAASQQQQQSSSRRRGGSAASAASAAADALVAGQWASGRERGPGGGLPPPLSLALSLTAFLVSRAFIGTTCFVAGVAYADALHGDRGQRQRAMKALRKGLLHLLRRVQTQFGPFTSAVTGRIAMVVADVQRWAQHTASHAVPVVLSWGTHLRASLTAPEASSGGRATKATRGRAGRHAGTRRVEAGYAGSNLAVQDEDEEGLEDDDEEDGRNGGDVDDMGGRNNDAVLAMPVRRAPHVLDAEDVMLASYDAAGTLSPRSVEDVPVILPSRSPAATGVVSTSNGASAGTPLKGAAASLPGTDSDDMAAATMPGGASGDQDVLAQQAEALSRAVRAAAARQAALDAAQAQLMLRELHSPGAASPGLPSPLRTAMNPAPGSPPPPPLMLANMEATSSLRAAIQSDAVRAATAAAVARQASDRAAESQGASLLRTGSSASAADEVFALEAVAQKQRAEAQAAVLAARARLAEVVAMTKRTGTANGSTE